MYESSAEPFISENPGSAFPISIATNRSINSTAACRSWPVRQGGDGAALDITIDTGTDGHLNVTNVSLPIAGGTDQTTFMTRDDGSSSCGPGCSRVTAFEASVAWPWFYDCNVTVGDVINATRPEHHIGPILKTLASSAIALEGYAASSLVSDPAIQYQVYPAEATYGYPVNGTSQAMAMLMARFALSVVAVTAFSNPIYIVPGLAPQLGVTLTITEWKYVHMIVGLICGIQLIMVIAIAFLVNCAIMRDDSPLATARVLRPIVDRLGPTGSNASGDAIAKELGRDLKVAYSVDCSVTPWCLQIQERRAPPQFPEGWYS